MAAVASSQAQTITTLTDFNGNDGNAPLAAPVQGSDGNFYGTTSAGGPYGAFNGTVFKVAPDGTLTTLHNFDSTDGAQPQTPLVLAADGNFYGTTWQGGADNYGTIFKISPSGNFTSLYSFTGSTDGRYPTWLIQASDGNFYGTALGGGNDNCGTTDGCGLVFKITSQGTYTKIFQFNGNSNEGAYPIAIVQGRDGNLYGTTDDAGGIVCSHDCGSVFKMTLTGNLTILATFNGRNGNVPSGQLLQATDGNFYGTTSEGGTYAEGTVFKMTPSGTLTSLYSFCNGYDCPDGAGPYSGVMQASNGSLYGTTLGGGTYGCTSCGTIFKITTNGNLTTLFSFDDRFYGGSPSRLLQASDGNFYGLTSGGGPNYDGTFYQFFTTGKTLYLSTSGDGAVTSTDGIINCPGTCSHVYPNNTQVTLNASPAQGSVFTGWSGACSGTGPCNVDMTQDQMVSATFLPLYTLTVTTTGSGSIQSSDGFINCPGTCTHVYVANTPINLTAYPAPGWSIDHWTGSCIWNGPTCYFSMDSDRQAGVVFTQDYYTLTVSMSGQGTITSTDGYIHCPGTCSHTYLSLTQITLNESPASGWNFSGWSGQCTGLGPCTFSILSNDGVSAYFMQPGSGLQFTPVTPCRLEDTRQTGNYIQGGTTENFTIPQLGGCNIPTSASAYSLNVTVAPYGPLGYLTVWPAGLAQPLTSTMNSRDGRTKATAVIVQAGTNNAISIYASNATNVILDINGYFSAPGSETYQFYPLTPCRVIDTRNADGPLGGPPLIGREKRDFYIGQSTCLPPESVPAYALNVTVVPYPSGQPLHYLTVWPAGETQPQVSTLNNGTATTVANAAIVPAGQSDGISVYVSDSTQFVVDVVGYFAAPGSTGLSLYPTAPCRVIDTRSNNGPPFQGELTVSVAGSVCAPPSNAQAYVFNATVAPPGPMHYLTLWADSELQPLASTLNAIDGMITSNMAIIPNTNGSTDAYASDPTQLILDISSYFAP
jgi:uncharacterized repeat protein (TIGR03803 family)